MKFEVGYADPPWKFRNPKTGGSHTSGAGQKYKVMELKDIHRMPVPSVMTDNAVMFLWVPTALKFSHGFSTLQAWDFQHYVTTWYWDKQQIGMGFWGRNVVEELLIGIRTQGCREPFLLQEANMLHIPGVEVAEDGSDSLLYRTLAGEHSTKPDEFRSMIERATKIVSRKRNLEMFARRTAPGWTGIGDLLTKQHITTDLKQLAAAA